MKLSRILIVIMLCLLCGCSKQASDSGEKADSVMLPEPVITPSAETEPQPTVTPTTAPETPPAELPTYKLAAFTDEVYPQVSVDILAYYAEIDALPEHKQDLKQSFMPIGQYTMDFGSWDECEEYFGFTLPNICSELEWLTPSQLPSGVSVIMQGERDGTLAWVILSTQYMCGDIKVNYGITVNTSREETAESPIYALDGVVYDKISETPAIYTYEGIPGSTSDSKWAVVIEENVRCNISVIAPDNDAAKSQEVLDKLLKCFYE